MTQPLLHICTVAQWRAALGSRSLAPPSLGYEGQSLAVADGLADQALASSDEKIVSKIACPTDIALRAPRRPTRSRCSA